MKPFILAFSFILALTGIGYAQGQVRDTHPNATIYTINYNTGQEALATNDNAILFKDALIDLVINTNTVRSQIKLFPGRKDFVITQGDIKSGYSFQVTYETVFLRQTTTIYTFQYNIDQNTLYYYNQGQQNWIPETIMGSNVVNLNNCLALSKFNDPVSNGTQQPQDNNQQTITDENGSDETAVDTSAFATTIPPELPEYDQPECPQDGYLWQPGYWAYNPDNGYYWVPGVWVAPPGVGLLWTPPYWGFDGGRYFFHVGYWGPTIGFYGGINYGFGYGGVGFVGGDWHDGHFRYNTAVLRVGGRVHNVYADRTVVVVRGGSHSSFNGRGGILARPNTHEIAAIHERHVMATSEQIRNQRAARVDRSQFASTNRGRPGNLAAERAPERNTNFNPGPRGGNNDPGNRPGNNRQGSNGPGNNGNVRPNNAPGNTPNNTPGSSGNNGNVRPNNAPGNTPNNTPGLGNNGNVRPNNAPGNTPNNTPGPGNNGNVRSNNGPGNAPNNISAPGNNGNVRPNNAPGNTPNNISAPGNNGNVRPNNAPGNTPNNTPGPGNNGNVRPNNGPGNQRPNGPGPGPRTNTPEPRPNNTPKVKPDPVVKTPPKKDQ